MRRLTILAKGNADVRDSLYALFEDGAPRWNGINESLRERGLRDVRVRVLHEIGVRSDMLLAGNVAPPARELPLGVWTADAQRRTRLFDDAHDAVILSIQPDVMTRLARRRDGGGVFYPHGAEGWPTADRRWLAETHEPMPPLTPDQSMTHLADVVARLRRTRGAIPILILNLSPVLPWERVHSYHGLGETLGERIRRFNLALIALSRETDVAIVDVESIVAREGAPRMKRDAVTFTVEGCRAVAAGVVDILEDVGLLAGEVPA